MSSLSCVFDLFFFPAYRTERSPPTYQPDPLGVRVVVDAVQERVLLRRRHRAIAGTKGIRSVSEPAHAFCAKTIKHCSYRVAGPVAGGGATDGGVVDVDVVAARREHLLEGLA